MWAFDVTGARSRTAQAVKWRVVPCESSDAQNSDRKSLEPKDAYQGHGSGKFEINFDHVDTMLQPPSATSGTAVLSPEQEDTGDAQVAIGGEDKLVTEQVAESDSGLLKAEGSTMESVPVDWTGFESTGEVEDHGNAVVDTDIVNSLETMHLKHEDDSNQGGATDAAHSAPEDANNSHGVGLVRPANVDAEGNTYGIEDSHVQMGLRVSENEEDLVERRIEETALPRTPEFDDQDVGDPDQDVPSESEENNDSHMSVQNLNTNESDGVDFSSLDDRDRTLTIE